MLSAAVSAHCTPGAIVLGVAYALGRFLRWQERRSMIKKTPEDQIVDLARALIAPKFIGRGAKREKTMPPG
jgi:hypothetical protein